MRVAVIFVVGAIIGTALGFVVLDTVGPAMVSPDDFAAQTLTLAPHNAAH